MNKKEIEEIVSNKLTNDLNFNEMQIRHETITDIITNNMKIMK